MATKQINLVYIVGRYPELTTTFIQREIETLRGFGTVNIQPVSLRFPLTSAATSADHKVARDETLYLISETLKISTLVLVIWAQLYFAITQPRKYFQTLIYLFTGEHPTFRDRCMTLMHFGLGVYATYMLRKRSVDHIHAHFIDRAVVVALVIGRLLDKPYSLTAHANSIFAKRILIREKIQNAKFAVTVSEYNKTYLLNTYPDLKPDKIHILHPWVNLAHFVPQSSPLVSDHLCILSVGRLVEKKGHCYLIEACHLLKERGVDFECRLVGAGPLQHSLEQSIAEYELQEYITLLGGRPQSEVVSLLKSWASVFVLPCVIAKDGDRDGIPVSLAEAMTMELPVISTDIVGISELVQPSAGMLVTSRDAVALADALQTLDSMSPTMRSEMGKQGRIIVDKSFNLVSGTMQLAQLFRDEH